MAIFTACSTFRLVIERTAAKATPQSWVAELAQVEVFGADAAAGPTKASISASAASANEQRPGLAPMQFVPKVEELGQGLAISTPWYRLVLDKSYPRLLALAMDSLDKGELSVNLLQEGGAYPILDPVFQKPMLLGTGAPKHTGNVFWYAPVEIAPGLYEQVSIRAGAKGFDLSLAATANHTVMMRGGLFRFQFAANQTPTTFVCHPSKLMNYVDVPRIWLRRISAWRTSHGQATKQHFIDGLRRCSPPRRMRWTFTPHRPTSEDGLNEIGPQPWRTTLHFAVQSLEPLPELLSRDPRLGRFPKYSLDQTQWRPDTGIVSNSVMSINCGLAMLFYAEQAVWAPHLENGISPMALVGASVDQYFKGARGYMMPNANVYSPEWKSSRETPAYLVVSAWYVIRTIGGMSKVQEWLKAMEALADHIEPHLGSNGLVDEPGKEWFDVYKFEGPDALSNVADYRAFLCMADVETLAGRPAMAKAVSGRCGADQGGVLPNVLQPCDGSTGRLEIARWEAARLHVSVGERICNL